MSMSFKNSRAERTTITRDLEELEEATNNIYETIAVLGKRADQINVDLKDELINKLNEFASTTDNLEEIFENREQIEISRYYERMPKPVAMAIDEYERGKIPSLFNLPLEGSKISSSVPVTSNPFLDNAIAKLCIALPPIAIK